jgi:LysM repeat protein
MERQIETAQRKLDLVVRQAHTEAGALRAELADARIAAAKQEAELQELRAQTVELRQTIEAQQLEATRLRADRDKFANIKSDLETQLVELPLLRQNLVEAKAALSALARVAPAAKAGGRPHQPDKPAAGPVDAPTIMPAVAGQTELVTAPTSGEPGTRRVRVSRHDTLWQIAARFQISIADLKEANGLQSDVIHEGQILVIPR